MLDRGGLIVIRRVVTRSRWTRSPPPIYSCGMSIPSVFGVDPVATAAQAGHQAIDVTQHGVQNVVQTVESEFEKDLKYMAQFAGVAVIFGAGFLVGHHTKRGKRR